MSVGQSAVLKDLFVDSVKIRKCTFGLEPVCNITMFKLSVGLMRVSLAEKKK